MFRKTYEIVAYSADADILCPECAAELYGIEHDMYLPKTDGITDNEGNPVHPVSLDNEYFQLEREYWGVTPACGNCHQELDV